MSIFLKLFVSICFALVFLSEAQATVWNCSTKDGTRKFPMIDVTSGKDGNMYHSILNALVISDEEYKSLGVECIGERPRAKTKVKPSSQATHFNTDGLDYSDDLTSIYVGEFEGVSFARDSIDMIGIVDGYLHAFSEQCKAALPKNKVELTKNVCDREEWQENGYGEIPGSRHCASSHLEGTGMYADPEVNNLNKSLQYEKYAGAINIYKLLRGNPLGELEALDTKTRNSKIVMKKLLTKNGCASQATKLFQANLIRFGRGIEAITTPGLKPPKGKMKEYQLELLTTSGVLWCGRDLCDNNMPLIDMLKTADHPKGPVVLVCQYTRSSLGYGKDFTYGFWYKAPPANIQALLAEDKKGNSFRPEDEKDNTGRLRWLGTQAAQQCPETKQKAKDLRRAALKETGYPDEPTAKK